MTVVLLRRIFPKGVPMSTQIILTRVTWEVLGKCRTLHTKEAHESYLMSKSLISRVAGQEKEKKNAAAAFLSGSGLK
jgi:hypothetical protein